MNKYIKSHFMPSLSSLSGIDQIKDTFQRAKALVPNFKRTHIVETFDEACKRLNATEAKILIIKSQKRVEARIYGFSAALMPIVSALTMKPGLISWGVMISLTLAIGMFWFSCAWRLWQINGRYLGTAKEFLDTKGWWYDWI